MFREKGSQRRLISYAADVHGNMKFIEKMLEESGKRQVRAIIINGDLTPDEYFIDILAQRSFFELILIPVLKRFKEKHKDIDVFVLMGNHDFSDNMNLFYKAEKEKIFYALHDRVHNLDEFLITGYSYIRPIGFINWEKTEAEIKKDMERLGKRLGGKRIIFVAHAPPFDTKLDIMHGKHHVGSRSIKEFIQKQQPYLSLHGHIHESPEMSGSITENIGKTLCVNPGNAKLIFIDLDTLDIER